MSTINRKPEISTHEGGRAKHINDKQALRRAVLSCFLWEDGFYESGQLIADRIRELAAKNRPEIVADLAIEARERMNLRHVPLLLVREMARLDGHKRLVGRTLARVIQRADELTEFLAIYWKDGRQPISKQVKLGLAEAFKKFSIYDLAKYDRDGAVKLRDVMFMVHPRPIDNDQEALFKALVDGTLNAPDTWEVSLSATSGEGKKEAWERLLRERKLGALALIRNLRNFEQSGVDRDLVRAALAECNTSRVLPFRFIAAAIAAPDYEPELERLMLRSVEKKMVGRTCILVDVSGSMDDPISAKSKLKRIDAACGIAMIAREIFDDCFVVTFSHDVVKIPPRRGFALRDAIVSSQYHNGTYLGGAIGAIDGYDRIIVITDEQSHDRVPDPKGKGYLINVAPYQNGVGYGAWVHIDGFSEATLEYIYEMETETNG